MSSDLAIDVLDVSKHYLIYKQPEDRLKQMIIPKLRRSVGLAPKKYYTDFSAVENVSLQVWRGETVGIIGRNGSGKSTLLQMICGTLQPTSGSVKVNGRIAALLELGAGFNAEFTGRENVKLNCAILGLSPHETEARFAAIEQFADIGLFMDQPVKTYSSGMYVRLAFAVAINVDPDILVVDEALAVGDEAFQRKCFARIEQIREGGATILFVSHGAQTIVQLCDRAVLLDQGKKLMDGEPRRVVSQYQRLINLTGERYEAARQEIMHSRSIDEVDASFGAANAIETVAEELEPASVEKNTSEADALDSVLEQFDPSLRSETRVDYEPNGVNLRNFRILNLEGAPVNSLALSRDYTISFDVEFLDDAENVEIGHHYSTKEGIHLGGRFITKEEFPSLGSVSAGTTLNIGFKFKCRFVPSTYGISVGVRGIRNNEHAYLARSIDLALFRVQTSRSIYFGGHFDFEFEPMIEETGKQLVKSCPLKLARSS
jgi:lipopolysaccharide transport system ATP-binding protein